MLFQSMRSFCKVCHLMMCQGFVVWRFVKSSKALSSDVSDHANALSSDVVSVHASLRLLTLCHHARLCRLTFVSNHAKRWRLIEVVSDHVRLYHLMLCQIMQRLCHLMLCQFMRGIVVWRCVIMQGFAVWRFASDHAKLCRLNWSCVRSCEALSSDVASDHPRLFHLTFVCLRSLLCGDQRQGIPGHRRTGSHVHLACGRCHGEAEDRRPGVSLRCARWSFIGDFTVLLNWICINVFN